MPAGNQALVKGLEHEWPRYLGYFVSFAFIGGVWIAHSNMTRFLKVAADDLAEEELATFAAQRRSAVLLQVSATVAGAFLPLLAVIFYLALAIFYVIDPVRLMHSHSLRRARLEAKSTGNLRVRASWRPRRTTV